MAKANGADGRLVNKLTKPDVKGVSFRIVPDEIYVQMIGKGPWPKGY